MALTAAMIRDGERELATVGIFQDLRERLQMEESLRNAKQQLEQTQKQAVLVELAGTTAHELNQPLLSVMGYAWAFETEAADGICRTAPLCRRALA